MQGVEVKLISIKEYANEHGVSYQAIDQQIKRNKEALKDHIIKQGKTRFLDEYAAAFLDKRRKVAVVSVVSKDKHENVEALNEKLLKYSDALLVEQQKNTELLGRLLNLQDEHKVLQDQYFELKLMLEQKQSYTESEANVSKPNPNQTETKHEPKANQSKDVQATAVPSFKATETGKTGVAEEVIAKKQNRLIRAFRVLIGIE